MMDKQKLLNKVKRDKVKNVLAKKIETTMIGALDSIEQGFGFLWGSLQTQEEREIYDIYQKVRKEILDRGGNQIRRLDSDLDGYEIKWVGYPFKATADDGGIIHRVYESEQDVDLDLLRLKKGTNNG